MKRILTSVYWFDLKGLINHLKNDPHDEREAFLYKWWTFVAGIFPAQQIIGNSEVRKADLTGIVVLLVMFVLGGLFAYAILNRYFDANGGSNGKHFLFRLYAISWVIGWRIFAVFIGPVIVFWNLPPQNTLSWVVLLALMVGGLTAFYYYYKTTIESLREINKGPSVIDNGDGTFTERFW